MNTNLYSIRDTKLNSYDMPWSSQNDDTAKRLMARMLKHIPLMEENPQDFDLYLIGHYDDTNAQIKTCSVQFIASGLELTLTPPRDDPNAKIPKTKVHNDTPIQPSS